MVVYYLDTSAAVKLYLKENGSDWLRQQLITDALPGLFSSELLRIELWSAFARRWREGHITSQEYRRMQDWFAEDRRSLYGLLRLGEPVIQQACQLIDRHPLRSYDAIHLASALTLAQRLVEAGEAGPVFLAADSRLNQVALAEGLTVDNPDHHPL